MGIKRIIIYKKTFKEFNIYVLNTPSYYEHCATTKFNITYLALNYYNLLSKYTSINIAVQNGEPLL